MIPDEKAPPGVDPTVPSVARMYDYYLGGKDNFAADREAAEKVIAISVEVGNDIRVAARRNREFLGRAVRMLAESGIRQFVDVGAGLPTQENVHEVVLRTAPDARVVYVDNDPIVLVHARALLADSPRTSVVEGDLRDPEGVLSHPEIVKRIDFGRPVALILCAILQFVPDDATAVDLVGRFLRRLPSGSHVVISHPFPGERPDDVLDEVDGIYSRTRSGSFTMRSREQIAALLAGAEPVPPGVAPVEEWRPGPGLEPDFTTPSYLGVVGRVP
ncbi:SAM-dependent methyltransferase [Actinomadura kijaniata]|uniref:O-methyltransferase involved in polyketide biosynthesis n=1 Tax=Actinomadura namibiensis TaxID=182080 RepID=A0A7W3LZE2_ACTNM|nr:SAM-dependent methyltransferase [Actinomadura namibiensis]MBA8957007.1 O-methyltransferase involved in polyketide biosynthesis [Actinomadura namibiensis]